MADYFARELDDVVHRLLPREIFADIGIVDAHSPSAAGSGSHVANGGNGGRIVRHAPGFGKNGTVFDSGAVRRLPRFVPNSPCAGANPPPASTGTGVFLPRPEVYQTRASKSPRNGAKPVLRLLRMEAGNAMTKTMKKQQQVHAMAAAILEQKKAFATAFQGSTELLALPHDWTY